MQRQQTLKGDWPILLSISLPLGVLLKQNCIELVDPDPGVRGHFKE